MAKAKSPFSIRHGKIRVRIKVGGKDKEASFINDKRGRANAETWLRDMQDTKEKIEKGIETVFEPIKVRPFVGRFLYEKSTEVEDTTLNNYREFFDRDFLPIFEDFYMHRITTEDLKAFLIRIQSERGFSASTFNRFRQDLNTLFNSAMKRKPKHVLDNPVTLLKKQTENPRPVVIFDDVKDMERFIERAWEVNPPFWIAQVLFLNTGGRIGEILALRHMDIDMENRVVHFRRQKSYKSGEVKEYTKGKTDREVPMNDVLYVALMTWLDFDKGAEPTDYVVRWKTAKNTHAWKFRENRPFSSGHFAKLHRELLRELKLPNVTPHGLRHTYATHNLGRDETLDIYRIQKLLGQKDIKTTERYLHLVKEKLLKKRNLFGVGEGSLARIQEKASQLRRLKVVK